MCAMCAALKAGHIVMHAFPFDAEPELLDPQVLDSTDSIDRS